MMWLWKKIRLLRNRLTNNNMRSVHLTFVLVLSLMMIAWILAIRSLFNESFKFAPSRKTIWEVRSVLLVHTEGCNVTTMDVFSRNMESRTPQCSSRLPRTESNVTTLWLRNPEDDKCCFRSLRPHDLDPDSFSFGEDCVDIPAEGYRVLNEKMVGPELVSVQCENSEEKDFHAFVPLRDGLVTSATKKVSVLCLSFSGLSTTSLPRLLPRTWSILHNDLNGVHIKGYSKIHNASFPSMCTATTGLDMEAYHSRCLSRGESSFPRESCPWAWSFFAKNGYRTMLVEDWPHSGLLQNAVPHYSPTHFLDAMHLDVHKSWNPECVGSRSQTDFLAAYLARFGLSAASADLPYFAVVWSHALKTNASTADHVDAAFADALRRLQHAGALRDAAVVLTSEPNDRELPALVLAPPLWFRLRFPYHLERLHSNRGRLTTPRDLYATLADIVHSPLVTLQDFRGFEALNGVSLLELISPLRTCEDAGIDPEVCPCYGESTPSY